MTVQEAKAKLERTSALWEGAKTEIVEAVKVAIKALAMQEKLEEWIEDYKRPCYDEEWSKEELLCVLEEFLVEEV